ncbi:hypothetical protein B0H13DRAFT_1885420 [Mycena leptocephala]|nr:hypothetical protein B0H13DRAFT_1885420 [Mycena leptocephala]
MPTATTPRLSSRVGLLLRANLVCPGLSQTHDRYGLGAEWLVSRLGTSAKVARKVVRSSASAISDLDDDSSESDANIHPKLRKAAVPKTPAAIVSEPKHAPSSAFRKQVTNSFSGLGDFMKMKAAAEEKKASVLDARLVIVEREKLEMDKRRESMAGASDEAKVAANTFLLNLFS